MKTALKHRHFVVLLAILMMGFFQSSSTVPEWNKVDLIVIDSNLGSEELRTESEFGVYVAPESKKDLRTVRAEMLIYMGYDVSITITSPYEPCGEASIVRYEFDKDGLKDADKNHDFYFFYNEDYPQLVKFNIKTSEPLTSSQHRALLSMFKFVEGIETDGERDILVNQVMVYRNTASQVTLTDFLEYGTFTHKLEENKGIEFDFNFDLENLVEGTMTSNIVTWSPKGRTEDWQSTVGWRITDEGELQLLDEARKWHTIEIKRVPETGETTFKGQPADDIFPQMWFEFDGKVYLSISTTSC